MQWIGLVGETAASCSLQPDFLHNRLNYTELYSTFINTNFKSKLFFFWQADKMIQRLLKINCHKGQLQQYVNYHTVSQYKYAENYGIDIKNVFQQC